MNEKTYRMRQLSEQREKIVDGKVMHVLLRLFNMLSFIGGILLLVAISWEILEGEHTHFSSAYMWIQFAVCMVFIADFVLRMLCNGKRGRFFVHNLWFLLLSIPYLNIMEWFDVQAARDISLYIVSMPFLRAFLAAYIVISWWRKNRVERLLWVYIFTVVAFTYISALMFFDFERNINTEVHTFGDAVMWACTNMTTLGSQIQAVTSTGKILTVMLPIFGMLLFPVFTAYVVQKFTGKPSTDE